MRKEINGTLMELVHNDGKCKNGKKHTPLDENGLCPACGFHPDMQSTSFMPVNPSTTSSACVPSAEGQAVSVVVKEGEVLGARKQRPACPFYGFVRRGSVLIDNNGNACGLADGHSPCRMEFAKITPKWQFCGYSAKEYAPQVEEILDVCNIFPEELRPPGAEDWDGVDLRGWFDLMSNRQ